MPKEPELRGREFIRSLLEELTECSARDEQPTSDPLRDFIIYKALNADKLAQHMPLAQAGISALNKIASMSSSRWGDRPSDVRSHEGFLIQRVGPYEKDFAPNLARAIARKRAQGQHTEEAIARELEQKINEALQPVVGAQR